MDANQLRFLESTENIKTLIHLRTGRELSTTRAREITSCLQQGRQFFEAAPKSPLETRPLIQFYGMMGFARALIIARQGVSLATLAKGHGLRDVSSAESRISELKARIETRGTFAEFNNEVAAANRVCYFDHQTHPRSFVTSCANSESLAGLEISLEDVLGRIPKLSSLFRHTYGKRSGSESLDQLYAFGEASDYQIRIVDLDLFDSRDSLRKIVGRWRERFPYLKRWRVDEASRSWGKSVITLANIQFGDVDDLSETMLREGEGGRFAAIPAAPENRLEPKDILEGVGGGYGGGSMFCMEQFSGRYISEFSLIYIGLFILSSLVRYRPDIWAHAVSRSSLQDRPVDDQLLALIESFLEQSLNDVTQLVIKLLNPHEDEYA